MLLSMSMGFISFIKKPIFVLTILLLIGFIIRVSFLGSIPGGFHEDEAHIGYNAYSLLHTLKDKNNVFLPIAIDQFGDFRPAGLHYLTIPSVAIFGLTEFATRLPVAVVGVLSILVIYFLSYAIFEKKSVALITAGLLTFNPWHIIASRSTSESIVALFFVMWGAYFIVKLLKTSKSQYIWYGAITFAISFLFYHAARYFVPFMLVYFFFVMLLQKQISKKIKIGFLVSAVIVLLFLGVLFKFGSGSGRVQEISIFGNPATKIVLWQQASEDFGQNVWITRFFHNVITDYGYTALINYGEHFSPDFLFFKGGLPPRYMAPWQGNFYILDGVFLLIGISFLVTDFLKTGKKDNLILIIPLVWLLLGPIPAALTFEDIPHFQRSIMMLSGFILLTGFGTVILWESLKGKWRYITFTVIGLLYLYGVLLFMHDYFHHSNLNQPWYRNEGQKSLVLALDSYVNKGFHIDMTTQNANRLIFYLFFNKVDPSYYQKIGSPRDHNMLYFENFILDDSTCPSNNEENLYKYKYPVLFVDAGTCKPKRGYKILQKIRRADNTVVFNIVQYAPTPQDLKIKE